MEILNVKVGDNMLKVLNIAFDCMGVTDENAIYEYMVYFPGTAYNLNFVLKREEGRI